MTKPRTVDLTPTVTGRAIQPAVIPPKLEDVRDKIRGLPEYIEATKARGVSLANILDIVEDIMKFVGTFNETRGHEKKTLVIAIITELALAATVGPFDILDGVIAVVVPRLIDQLIAVEKGQLRFNPKVKESVIGCLPCTKPSKK